MSLRGSLLLGPSQARRVQPSMLRKQRRVQQYDTAMVIRSDSAAVGNRY